MPSNKSLVTRVREHLNDKYNFRYNEITRQVEIDGQPIIDRDINSIYLDCKAEIKSTTKDLILSCIYSKATESYNPFKDFIKWNKHRISRNGNIDRLIASIKTDTANHDLFIKKWLCGMMASIYGTHSPLMLVLAGGQNTGKTTWFRRLLPDELSQYYAEGKLDDSKDGEILMVKKLIIIDDEAAGRSKVESKRLKELTSKQIFSIRQPYGRLHEDLQRLAILGGTSNDMEVLNDPTGNRRILPIHVISIDHALYNSINKADLFMEVYGLYKSGYDHNLSKTEIELLNNSTQNFEEVSAEQEMILKLFAIPGEDLHQLTQLTNTEITSKVQAWLPQIRTTNKKVGQTLKKLGFQQKFINIRGVTSRVYEVVELNAA